MSAPETMLADTGTRHKVGRLIRESFGGPIYRTDCGTDARLNRNAQDWLTHKRDCKRCFGDPTIPTFEAGELEQLRASLESVRGIAATLEADNKRLREALAEAANTVADWGAYAGGYFQEKWGLADDVAEIRAAAALPSPHGENNE